MRLCALLYDINGDVMSLYLTCKRFTPRPKLEDHAIEDTEACTDLQRESNETTGSLEQTEVKRLGRPDWQIVACRHYDNILFLFLSLSLCLTCCILCSRSVPLGLAVYSEVGSVKFAATTTTGRWILLSLVLLWRYH